MRTLLDVVPEVARRFPDHPALLIRPSFRTRVWRYRDLADIVPRAASVLSEAGVKPGDRVVIWGVNRPEWGIAFLALLHAGAIAVPLDVRQAVDFARKVVAQTGANHVLATRQTAEGAQELGLPITWIESLPDRARRNPPLPTPPIEPDDLAEIVFTSGTTGTPKGVMLTHGNMIAFASAVVQVFPFSPGEERFLSVLPLSHLFEQLPGFITPLMAGASIVYPVSRQPAVLLRTFRDYRPTMLLIVPQGLRLLDHAIERKVDEAGRRAIFERLHQIARRSPGPLRRLLFRRVRSQRGGRLHTIAVAASALDSDLARRWMDMDIRVLQGYGATEIGVSFTHPNRNRLGTVGEAIPGVEIQIAADGEVLARGPNRFQGYWQNPEATAAAIDPEGWYHTGDLGELSADGFLTFRGRKKDMIALPDGQKVYPEDVEAILLEDGRVREATVVGWPHGADLRVHAVLTLDQPSLADAIVGDANARLGAHQQIRGVTVWPDEELPKTHTLKVRKFEVMARLDEIAAGAAQSATTAAPVPTRPSTLAQQGRPVSAAELLPSYIASIASIRESDVRPDARLSSDLNMDSLQRVELLSVIEEELGSFIDDADLDPDATVAELAVMVEAARGAQRQTGIYGWPLNPLVRLVGLTLQAIVMRPLTHVAYRWKVTGLEHLGGLEGPVLFTPNHNLHLDNAIIFSSLPRRWRWKLSVAAGAETIYGNRLSGVAASVLVNAFPLQREGGVRHSLELLGARLDRGYSILVFPEGMMTSGGPIQPFKSGAGLVAVEGATPVVPMRLKVERMSFVDRWMDRSPRGGPWRGSAELIFGEPIRFDADEDPVAATERLEAAVRAL